MTRKECLDKAAECVLRDRQKQYGEPEDCFETIAMMWSAYLGKTIQGWDVAAMMALLKIARIKANPAHADNWCDLAGYAACGAECRQKCEAEMKKTVEDAFETFPHLKPKAEGCEEPEFKPGDKVRVFFCGKEAQNGIYLGEGPEGMKSWTCRVKTDDGEEGVCAKSIVKKLDWACSEQEFKPGDRVQYRASPPSVSDSLWRDATYVEHRGAVPHPHTVRSDKGLIFVKDEDIRPAPKAEGVEELVQKDAPQTAQELYDRILSCNPATYGRASKPTGEELAEMAEEEPHG